MFLFTFSDAQTLDELLAVTGIERSSDIWEEATKLFDIMASDTGKEDLTEAFDLQENLISSVLDLDIFNEFKTK